MYNSENLDHINSLVCDNIDKILENLDVDLINRGRMYTGACPIHGGDNIGAINFYPNGDFIRGYWICRTHGCEKIFKKTSIGLVRGILSRKFTGWSLDNPSKLYSFPETLKYIKDLLAISTVNERDLSKKKLLGNILQLTKTVNTNQPTLSRKEIRAALDIPSGYFLQRGYSGEILDKYDIGTCNNKLKPMFLRAVVPVYNDVYTHMVGCLGRSVFESCHLCKSYHSPNTKCPAQFSQNYCKWLNQKNFRSHSCLYNWWFAKDKIVETKVVCLVESVGNVLRLEECGICNSVAMFGSELSDEQKIILECSGAMSIILLLDNDRAGKEASNNICNKLKRDFNLHEYSVTQKDIGEMSHKDIQKDLVPFIKSVEDNYK